MKPAIWLALLALPLCAQDNFRKHNFTFGGGVYMPGGQLTPALSNAPGFRFGYGYRFHRFFQGDFGIDTGFGSADVRDFYDSEFGELRIRDYQYYVPMGGRVVVPLANEKFQLYAGGGGAFMRYSERIRQPFANYGYRIDCPVCRSRDGWGYYALAGGSVALDRAKMFRLGIVSKFFRGDTTGEALGALPAFRTTDRWRNIAAEFTFSF
jgi:hypothetical protein